MHFYKRILISLFIFMGSFIATASESTCHYPTQSGICYHSENQQKSCGLNDPINVSGTVSAIHSKDVLPQNYPLELYYQHYYQYPNDTISRFTHWSRSKSLPNAPLTIENRDSIYAKVIQITNFTKWKNESSSIDSSASDMMNTVDSNFILISWDTQIQKYDSIVIHGYLASMDLMCGNINGKGIFDGEYTIYPASTTTSLPNEPNSQNHQTPIRYYTVDGKLQTQKPEFVPVVGVKNRQ